MTLNIKWSVNKLKVIPQQGEKLNVVTVVEWLVQATDEVNNLTASASGLRELKLGDSFTTYDQLTEQQVLDWCFEPEIITTDEGGTTIKHIKVEGEAQVTDRIARQLAEKQSEPALPWV